MKLLLIAIFITGLNSFCSAQSKNKVIEDIVDIVESIRMDTALKSVTLLNDEFLDSTNEGGGELTGFYKNKKLYYFYRSAGIKQGEEIKQFYYRKNKIIFVSEKFNTYFYNDSLKTYDYTVLNTTFTGKYYFENEKLIHKVITGGNENAEDSTQIEKRLLNESRINSDLIKKRIDKL